MSAPTSRDKAPDRSNVNGTHLDGSRSAPTTGRSRAWGVQREYCSRRVCVRLRGSERYSTLHVKTHELRVKSGCPRDQHETARVRQRGRPRASNPPGGSKRSSATARVAALLLVRLHLAPLSRRRTGCPAACAPLREDEGAREQPAIGRARQADGAGSLREDEAGREHESRLRVLGHRDNACAASTAEPHRLHHARRVRRKRMPTALRRHQRLELVGGAAVVGCAGSAASLVNVFTSDVSSSRRLHRATGTREPGGCRRVAPGGAAARAVAPPARAFREASTATEDLASAEVARSAAKRAVRNIPAVIFISPFRRLYRSYFGRSEEHHAAAESSAQRSFNSRLDARRRARRAKFA